jgi:hypothetical protein
MINEIVKYSTYYKILLCNIDIFYYKSNCLAKKMSIIIIIMIDI